MKWNCDLIQDLLPLYEEDLCSPGSRQAVEEHLCECKTCRRLTAPLPIAEQVDTAAADRAVKKSMRKVKRRWLASLAAAVLAVPLLLLSINQHRGSGLCFTNLDDIYTAWQFVHALETQNWEKAAQMPDKRSPAAAPLPGGDRRSRTGGTGRAACRGFCTVLQIRPRGNLLSDDAEGVLPLDEFVSQIEKKCGCQQGVGELAQKERQGCVEQVGGEGVGTGTSPGEASAGAPAQNQKSQ